MSTIEVKTNLGILTATPVKDDNFPGIKIRLGDEVVAIIEESEGKIRTIAFNNQSDEAEEIIDFNEIENDLSNDEREQLDAFFDKGKFINAIDKYVENAPFKYMWDDFNLLKSHFTREEESELFFYTLVECDDDEAWIVEGKKFVNRIGYFVSRTKIDIPEEGIRYW